MAFKRTLVILLLVGGATALLVQIWLVSDLRAFEFAPILAIVGWPGIVFFVTLSIGFYVVVLRVARSLLGRGPLVPATRAGKVTALVWCASVVWFLDWILLEAPISVRIQNAIVTDNAKDDALQRARAFADSIGGADLLLENSSEERRNEMAIMIARVAINRPRSYQAHPLGKTVREISDRYDVNPTLMFAWLYLDSFYGEAVSGPMPIFRDMNPETFRDLIQIHLPSWFVESTVRTTLVESDWLEVAFGSGIGSKLRYALHKATYDVSTEPYDTNTFSDALLVLIRYRNEFAFLLDPDVNDPIEAAIRDSLDAIGDTALIPPYDRPETIARYEPSYYAQNRGALITFARAVFYKLVLDFEFSTRVQALTAKYYDHEYATRLGESRWTSVSEPGKLAAVAMLRDVYVPNIGALSYNLYQLPELNCTPYEFVAEQLERLPDGLVALDGDWRPRPVESLWSGAAFKLRSLAEVWNALEGTPFAERHPAADTIGDSMSVVTRNRARIPFASQP